MLRILNKSIAEGIINFRDKLCVLDKEVITQQQQNKTHTNPCQSHDSDPGPLARTPVG